MLAGQEAGLGKLSIQQLERLIDLYEFEEERRR
jgi:hypothetical protein